jgi:hypothetical protein
MSIPKIGPARTAMLYDRLKRSGVQLHQIPKEKEAIMNIILLPEQEGT